MLKLMKPPLETSKQSERGPGMYELKITGLPDEAEVRYLVQLAAGVRSAAALSDDRHALRRRHGAGTNDRFLGRPRRQRKRQRPHGPGDAARLHRDRRRLAAAAPDACEYSAREHHAVLGALRDACRRFSIDTDRVYLTGHGMGGDSAWDIAIAHPDVWAGVIPVVAVADKFVTRYAKMHRMSPGTSLAANWMAIRCRATRTQFDRYLQTEYRYYGVEYLGRGYEPFGDEIQRLFDWMGRKQAQDAEGNRLRNDAAVGQFLLVAGSGRLAGEVDGRAGNWPPPHGVRPATMIGKRLETNKVSVKLQASKVTVWLSPDLVDFTQPLVVEVNNHSISPRDRIVHPDLSVLLEDARTRADRQHPFWAKLSTQEK